MKQHEITLTPADLHDITAGTLVHVMTDDGTEIVISTEDAWQGPARSPGVYRVGLSDRHLDYLRYGRSLPVFTADDTAKLVFTVDAEAVTR